METPPVWQIEILRFTLFHVVNDQPLRAGLWESIVGNPPESRSEKPSERIIIEEGEWLGHRLVVSSQLGRLDVVFQSIPREPSLPNGGEFTAVIPEFRKLLPTDIGVPITRLAFGAVLLHPEPNQASAYSTLGGLLPGVAIRSNTKEFMYQINTPVQSDVDMSLELNRISRWNAILMQIVSLPSSSIGTLELFATRLELDISSAQDVNINDQAILPELANEMISKAIEISLKGDQL